MKNWKQLLEKALTKEHQGATIKWNGDNPTLIIPDELKNKETEIIEYITNLWSAWGGEVKFHPEKAIHSGQNQ